MCAQFVALEFYLKELFERISTPADLTRKAHNINNYKIIVNRIKTHTDGKACIATFNYDTLFEDSLLSGIPIKMNDYISGDIKIIKLHGSHNWGYIQRLKHLNFERTGAKTSFEWCTQNPDFLDKLRSGDAEPHHTREREK